MPKLPRRTIGISSGLHRFMLMSPLDDDLTENTTIAEAQIAVEFTPFRPDAARDKGVIIAVKVT